MLRLLSYLIHENRKSLASFLSTKVHIFSLYYKKGNYFHAFLPDNDRIIGQQLSDLVVYSISQQKVIQTLNVASFKNNQLTGGLFTFSEENILIYTHQPKNFNKELEYELTMWNLPSNKVINHAKGKIPPVKWLISFEKVANDHYYYLIKGWLWLYVFEFCLNQTGKVDLNIKINYEIKKEEKISPQGSIGTYGVLNKSFYFNLHHTLKKLNIETGKQITIFTSNQCPKALALNKGETYLVFGGKLEIILIDTEKCVAVKSLLISNELDNCFFSGANLLIVKTNEDLTTYKLSSKRLEAKRAAEKIIKFNLINLTGISKKIEACESESVEDLIEIIREGEKFEKEKKIMLMWKNRLLECDKTLEECKLIDGAEVHLLFSQTKI